MWHNKRTNKATFAGGCFWCMEPPFTGLTGVIAVYPGYTGGKTKNPTYKQVMTGKTGHVEAIQIDYDEALVSYNMLIDLYWKQIDPTDDEGQFKDKGDPYKTVIFFHSESQREIAEKSKKKLDQSGKFDQSIVTKVKKSGPFYIAEEYHQQFFKKNPDQYKQYKIGSGRESFVQKCWKKSSEFPRK